MLKIIFPPLLSLFLVLHSAVFSNSHVNPLDNYFHFKRGYFGCRSKYELQEFLKPSLRIVSGKSNLSSSSNTFMDSFRSAASQRMVTLIIC
jgi:stromal membrane-associated protein